MGEAGLMAASPPDVGGGGFAVPTQNKVFAVRTTMRPWANAGLAKIASPSSNFASSFASRPASTTTTRPLPPRMQRRSPAIAGDACTSVSASCSHSFLPSVKSWHVTTPCERTVNTSSPLLTGLVTSGMFSSVFHAHVGLGDVAGAVGADRVKGVGRAGDEEQAAGEDRAKG